MEAVAESSGTGSLPAEFRFKIGERFQRNRTGKLPGPRPHRRLPTGAFWLTTAGRAERVNGFQLPKFFSSSRTPKPATVCPPKFPAHFPRSRQRHRRPKVFGR